MGRKAAREPKTSFSGAIASCCTPYSISSGFITRGCSLSYMRVLVWRIAYHSQTTHSMARIRVHSSSATCHSMDQTLPCHVVRSYASHIIIPVCIIV
eukprot:2921608-Lingulodinium_polyedra.AAC.1